MYGFLYISKTELTVLITNSIFNLNEGLCNSWCKEWCTDKHSLLDGFFGLITVCLFSELGHSLTH